MPKNKSLTRQVYEVIGAKLRIGGQKHLDKQQGTSSESIYSWNTNKTYISKCVAFVKWAKEKYSCRTLEQARSYVNAYLQHYIDNGYSPSTQSTIKSSLAKLYGCSSTEFIKTQPRRRMDIIRSRQGKALARFSEKRNQEFVDFCRATGLRRHEIENLRAEHVQYNNTTKQYYITGLKGKGGRLRECPILSKEAVGRILNTQLGQKVWPVVPANADVHSYRADYCAIIYERYARPISDIPKQDRYYCRNDLKGVIYDKRAMAVASRFLGHNRIDVIAKSYLYHVAERQLEQLAKLKDEVRV